MKTIPLFRPLFLSAARPLLVALVLLGLAIPQLRADYTGPVPPPADAFGGPGAFAVITETFPSPRWPGQVVTVLRPDGAEGPRPTWFFAHGFGGNDPAYYRELLHHLASHGAVVVFSPYPTNLLRVADNYSTLYDGFAAAAERYAGVIDTTRVGFAGHSYGGGAVPALALRAVRERGWGSNGLAILMLAPWYSYFVTDADLASFPADTQAVVEVYEDDTMNDHRMAIDLFTRLNLADEQKDFLMLRSDRIDGYNYAANHRVPTGTGAPGEDATFNALDAWGVLRVAQALGASAWDHDAAARAVALGNGSAEQTTMGAAPGGRALRTLVQTDHPVPLFPSSRYVQRWNAGLNPRAGESLPQPVRVPHLANLSARARAGEGAEALMAGAVVTGARAKSLLVRAVGPGLAGFGVAQPMPDPRLVTYRGTAPDIEVDNASQAPELDALEAARAETGAFPLQENTRDAALLASFSPGVVTMHALPADGIAGDVLLEIYAADNDDQARLSNLSARARVGTGNDVVMAGFVAAGDGDLQLLVRGVGPALAEFGVPEVLPNPRLEVYRGDRLIAANDDWSTDATPAEAIRAAASQAGAFPLATGSTDASLLLTVPPGQYTAHLRSADGRTGIGMIEIYVVSPR